MKETNAALLIERFKTDCDFPNRLSRHMHSIHFNSISNRIEKLCCCHIGFNFGQKENQFVFIFFCDFVLFVPKVEKGATTTRSIACNKSVDIA